MRSPRTRLIRRHQPLPARHRLLTLCVLLTVDTMSVAAPASDSRPVAEFRKEVDTVVRSGQPNRGPLIQNAFSKHFGNERQTTGLSYLPSSDLSDRLDALATVSHIRPDARLGSDAWELVDILEARGDASTADIAKLHRMLFAERSFDSADQLRRRFVEANLPASPRLERLTSSGAYNAYAVSRDGAGLLEMHLGMRDFTGLLAVGHPSCAFSRRAAEWMHSAGHGDKLPVRWIAPVDGNLHMSVIAAWNAKHPDQPLLLARHEGDWPFVIDWDTPQFFQFVRGRLTGHVSGWNRESRIVIGSWLSNGRRNSELRP